MSADGRTPPVSTHDVGDWFEQRPFRLRFGWGPNGLRRLAPGAAVVVIVDVLSFSTAVDVALGRGVTVLPYRWHDGTEEAYARANGAQLAARRPEPGRLSLRPSSLAGAAAGVRLVLPSPNGSALTFAAAEAGAAEVLVGSLRNAGAVGRAAARAAASGDGASAGDSAEDSAGGEDVACVGDGASAGPRQGDGASAGHGDGAGGGVVAVIAAGERWRGTTGPLRPAVEDLLGAGAILAAVAAAMPAATASPEASVALAAFAEARPVLADRVRQCGSGQELVARGFGADVELAVELDVSGLVPRLAGAELVA